MVNHQAEEAVVGVADREAEGAVEVIILDVQDTVASNKAHPHHPEQGMEEVEIRQMQIVTVTLMIVMSHRMKSLLLRRHRVRVTSFHQHHWHATKHIMKDLVWIRREYLSLVVKI